MATKKPKKGGKKKKEKDPDAPKHEVDPVKSFIYVMIVFILALGVFVIIRMGDLDQVESDLANARSLRPKVRTESLEIQAYLDLIKNSGETELLRNPTTFFTSIYQSGDVRVPDKDVQIPQRRETKNVKDRYWEYYWDIAIDNVNREQLAQFMRWVEIKSPKAKSIELSLRRRNTKDLSAEDNWDAVVKVGYRTALTK